MSGEQRREQIIEILRQSKTPVSGTALAKLVNKCCLAACLRAAKMCFQIVYERREYHIQENCYT